MDFTEIFRIVNLVTGVFMLLGGITQFIGGFGPHNITIGVYLIIFGAATGLLEFQIPPQVSRYASFMFSFLGRGLFYFFVGALIVEEHWYRWVPGSLVMFVGIAYIVLEFVPSIEPPANMRDADAGWGQEQV
ncbi:COPI associated [Microthyrium microscopicum]|uniref:COPI associated n=1 Tax=Microthyrium microscopicum TaxID=703497 RepID=A0A6A6UIG1_9PEZI|nr:COPI associated [Microthyrium microscopicum]